MLIFVEFILHSTENNIINNNRSIRGDKVNAQNVDDNVEVETNASSAADEQEVVVVAKANHFSNAYGNIVMTTKRPLNEDKMSRPIIQTATATTTVENTSDDKDDNMIGNIMVPLPPELSDNSTIENFNSRRRRGRLRTSSSLSSSSCPFLLLPSPLPLPIYNNKQNKTKRTKQKQKMKVKQMLEIVEQKGNATKNIIAALEPINTATSILLSKLLLLLLLLSFLIKYYVNKLIDKLINLTAACASKLFDNYNYINYNSKRSLKCNKQQQHHHHHHHHHSYNSYYKHSHNAGLVYAFILCTSILLPSNTNLAVAFKPKSVQTQLQQQEHQQQQQQQNQHQQTKHRQHATTTNDNNNNNNNKNLQQSDAYEMMIPIPQDDDAEFLSSQSQEHFFDDETNQNSNLNLNEENAADMYDTHRNGG